MDSQINK